MKCWHGSVSHVPRQDPGAIAFCAFCPWARFFKNSSRKKGSARSRAKRALLGHARLTHQDKFPKFWDGKE
jgi:hypothetical protein